MNRTVDIDTIMFSWNQLRCENNCKWRQMTKIQQGIIVKKISDRIRLTLPPNIYIYIPQWQITDAHRPSPKLFAYKLPKNWVFIIGKCRSYVSEDLYCQPHAMQRTLFTIFDERNKRARHMNKYRSFTIAPLTQLWYTWTTTIQWVYVCNSNNSLIRIYWWTTSKTKYTKRLSRKLFYTERTELAMEIATLYRHRHLCVSHTNIDAVIVLTVSTDVINFSAFAKGKVPHLKWISCKLQFVYNLSDATDVDTPLQCKLMHTIRTDKNRKWKDK